MVGFAMAADTLTPEERSERMARVRGRNTKPELFVRRLIRAWGYRCRYHVRNLPGCPDFVFPSRKKAIFVHGCFWHRHEGCGRLPKSKLDFWRPKLEENRNRDLVNQKKLQDLGWGVLVIWECELRDRPALLNRIRTFLEEGLLDLEGDE